MDREIFWRSQDRRATQIILIRHGESEANIGLSTDPNCVLTEKGKQQARAVGERLKDVDLSQFIGLVSPYDRARTTARLVAEQAGVEFQIEPAIREWGKPCTIDDVHYPAESRQELAARIAAFIERMRGRKIVLVSHAVPIAEMVRIAEGRDLNLEIECFWEGIDNCCLYKLTES